MHVHTHTHTHEHTHEHTRAQHTITKTVGRDFICSINPSPLPHPFPLRSCRLQEARAKQIYAIMTHGVLSGPALQRIAGSSLEKVVVTNSIPQGANCEQCPKIQVSVHAHVHTHTHHTHTNACTLTLTTHTNACTRTLTTHTNACTLTHTHHAHTMHAHSHMHMEGEVESRRMKHSRRHVLLCVV